MRFANRCPETDTDFTETVLISVQTLITFVNKHLNKLNLEVAELDTQVLSTNYVITHRAHCFNIHCFHTKRYCSDSNTDSFILVTHSKQLICEQHTRIVRRTVAFGV